MTVYPIKYHILDSYKDIAPRTVEVLATPDDLAQFARDGYLVRPQVFPSEHLDRLRAALAEVVAREGATEGGEDVFLRDLMDKHPAFLDLLRFAPTLSVARAMLGPNVQVQPLSARIAYPTDAPQFTTWHFHQRLIPEPYPPFFTRPHVLDGLVYLDDANEINGPLLVVPGSHERLSEELPVTDATLPGQIMLMPRAGDVVLIHGSLWHRALPTGPAASVRRLLILSYCAAWTSFGPRRLSGLTAHLLEGADPETRELLGAGLNL